LNRKNLYIAALDYKDAFGSVWHQQLNIILNKLDVPTRLRKLIMDSYYKSQARIWSPGVASRPIDIHKRVNQECPLIPLLFNICVDPLKSCLPKEKDLGYQTVNGFFSLNNLFPFLS
jgi:hypothetical protein